MSPESHKQLSLSPSSALSSPQYPLYFLVSLGSSLELYSEIWCFIYSALLGTPKTAPACRAKQNKDREKNQPTKQTKKKMDFHPFFWKYSSIEGKRRLISIRILAPAGAYCCQLLLSQWDCLRVRVKENGRKKTKDIKLYTLSVKGSFSHSLSQTRGFLFELSLFVPQWLILVFKFKTMRYQKRKKYQIHCSFDGILDSNLLFYSACSICL